MLFATTLFYTQPAHTRLGLGPDKEPQRQVGQQEVSEHHAAQDRHIAVEVERIKVEVAQEHITLHLRGNCSLRKGESIHKHVCTGEDGGGGRGRGGG